MRQRPLQCPHQAAELTLGATGMGEVQCGQHAEPGRQLAFVNRRGQMWECRPGRFLGYLPLEAIRRM